MPLFPSREKCSYFNCFCEENVWKLCDTVRCKNPALVQHCFAVFISNEQKMVPIWQNRGSQAEDGMVIWDYHVVFVYKSPDGPEVYDMDSTLPFPVPIAKYVREALRYETDFQPEFRRKFRIIRAMDFLTHFASDRTHMKDENTGAWIKPPPDYAPIKTNSSTNNIEDYISMDPMKGKGAIKDLNGFLKM